MEIWVVKGNRFPKAEIRFVFLNFFTFTFQSEGMRRGHGRGGGFIPKRFRV